MAAEFLVVHLKIRHRDAGLTSPAVATQDPLAQAFVRQEVQSRGNGFRAFSGRLFTQVFEENLLLFAGQELVVA